MRSLLPSELRSCQPPVMTTVQNTRIHYQMTSVSWQRTSRSEQTNTNCLYLPNWCVLCYLTLLSPILWYKFWSNLKTKNLRVNLISRQNRVLVWSSKDHSWNRNANICTCELTPTAYRNTNKWRSQKWRQFRPLSSYRLHSYKCFIQNFCISTTKFSFIMSTNKYRLKDLIHSTQTKKCILISKAHQLTYLLTHSMVQSPSWEANWFAASQEIPRISRNPKVHYRTHKRPSPIYPGPAQSSPYTHIPPPGDPS